jgi:hypothetical protein
MPANDDAPDDARTALMRGARRVRVDTRRDRDPIPELAGLLAAAPGRVLVACEFDRVRPCLAGLAGNDAGPWPHDGRFVVGNYEKLGLYARFAAPDAFSLVVLMPRLGQNARSAGVLVERFADAAIVQYAWDGSDIEPDAVVGAVPTVVPLRRAS